MTEENGELKQVSVTAEELMLLERARQTESPSTGEVSEPEVDETVLYDDDETDEVSGELEDDGLDFDDDDAEETEGDESDDVDAASQVEVSLKDVKVEDEDDTDEFSYLFDEDEAEPVVNTTEAPAKAEAVVDTGVIPRYLQAGTKEYFSSIKNYAEARVTEALGVGGDGEPIEYDQFDDEHRVMFDHFVSEGKKLVADKSNEIKTQAKNRETYEKASGTIDAILSTPELGDKYVAVCDNMKVKDKKKLDAQIAKGDYSGYIKLAERVKKTYGKAQDIKSRTTKRLKKKGKTESLDDSLSFMGY